LKIEKRLLFLSCVILGLAVAPAGAGCDLDPPADCVYVDNAVGSNCADLVGGGTQVAPFCTIQFAYDDNVTSVRVPMAILVMPGVYNECLGLGVFDLQGDLQPFPTYLDKPVHLIADAWDEAGRPVPNPADTSAFETVVGLTTITGLSNCDQNSIPGATVSIAGSDSSLEGFTIELGGDSGVNARGGVDVSHNWVRNNRGSLGGGIFLATEPCAHSLPAPEPPVFMQARICSNLIENNLADDFDTLNPGTGGSGGGIFVDAEGIANKPGTPGPGICNRPGGRAEVKVEDNIVRNNTARNLVNGDEDTFASGGGMAIEPITASSAPTDQVFPTPLDEWQVQVLISGNTVRDNTVEAGIAIVNDVEVGSASGAGIATLSSGVGMETLEIFNNTVGPNNVATSMADQAFGGGISMSISPAGFGNHEITIDGNSIFENEADVGGGLDMLIQPLDLERFQSLVVTASGNSIEDNTSRSLAGGVHTEYNSDRSLDLSDASLFTPAPVDFLADEISVTIKNNSLRNNTSEGLGGGAVLRPDANADPESEFPYCAAQRPSTALIDFFGNFVEGNVAETATLVGTGRPGCSDTVCQNEVCAFDPFCCDVEWDDICIDEAINDPYAPSCNCNISNCCGSVIIGSGVLVLAVATGEAVAHVSITNSTIVGNPTTLGGLVGGVEVRGVTLEDCPAFETGATSLTIDRSIIADNDGFGVGGPIPAPSDLTPTVTDSFVFDNGVSGGAGQYQPTLFPQDPQPVSDDPLLDPVTFVPGVCSTVYDLAGFCDDNPATPCLKDDDCTAPGDSCVAAGAGFLASPDINHDKAVDGVDLLRFSTGFGAEDDVDLRYRREADLDRNGTIDGIDLMFIAPLFAQKCTE